MTKNIEVVENIDFGVQFNHEVKDLNLQKEILMILLIKNVFSIIIAWGGEEDKPWETIHNLWPKYQYIFHRFLKIFYSSL